MISGQGTKIPQATRPKKYKNKNKKAIDQMASLCTLLTTPIGLKLFLKKLLFVNGDTCALRPPDLIILKPSEARYQRSGLGGTSLAVQWLRLHASNARGAGSNPGRGAKILHATWHSQENFKKKKEKKSGLGKHASKGCRLRWADTAISGKFQKAKLEIAMHWQQFM